MVGQLMYAPAKGRGRAERVALGPLAALRWTVYAPEGMARWRLARRLRRGERALAAEGVDPRRGRVALSAPRLCGELVGAAQRLCPQVRGLLIDAPGGGEYAQGLQRRFGLPVTPASAGADATVAFGPAGGRWGRCVELYEGGTLNGLSLAAEGMELPADCGEQVLALLWERGEVKREQLCAQLIDKPAAAL